MGKSGGKIRRYISMRRVRGEARRRPRVEAPGVCVDRWDATGGRGWVGVKDKVVKGLVVLEVLSRVSLITRTFEEDYLPNGTEGRNIIDPGRDTIVGVFNAVEGAGTVFVAAGSVVG